MAPNTVKSVRDDPAERVRDRVLTALHVGRLRSGDRVPSIRRQARLVGVNTKTVHRTYAALAREGILDVRPGSGTFVSERRSGGTGRTDLTALLGALDTCRAEAERLGIDDAELAKLLRAYLADGLPDLVVGVVECNMEQIVMIGRDLHRAMGVRIVPVQLDALARDPEQALRDVEVVVTTDCHWGDVVRDATRADVPAYAVAFDQGFPRRLLRAADDADVLLIVGDRRFGPVFARLLAQLAGGRGRAPRVTVVDPTEAGTLLPRVSPGTWVWVSPTVAAGGPPPLLPERARRFDDEWRVRRESLESLRAAIVADRVSQPADAPLSTELY